MHVMLSMLGSETNSLQLNKNAAWHATIKENLIIPRAVTHLTRVPKSQ